MLYQKPRTLNVVKLKSTPENSEMNFIGFNLDGIIVCSSQKMFNILNSGTAPASKISELLTPYPDLLQAAHHAMQGTYSKQEIQINQKYFLVEMILHSPLLQEADIIALFTDITFIKNREQQLQQQTQQLKALNKELENFAYVTSHDLREPFRTATNFAQLIEKKYASSLDDDANKYLQYIIEGTKNGQHLVNDLLSYYRVCKAKMKPLWVYPKEIVLLQTYNIKETIDLKDAIVNIDLDVPVYADPKWLGMIFYHLLKNAVIHNTQTQPKIDISLNNLETEQIITVEDNGIGINREHHKSVFELLRKVGSRPNLKGSGIGLSICKKIINLHQGKIWLESQVGKGSKFIISLPRPVS